MKNKIKVFILILSACLIIVTTISVIYYQNVGKYWPKTVWFKPAGFITLDSAMAGNEDFIHYEFFETAVFFLDKDNNGLGTWGVRDSSFIVRYSGEFYINKDLFDGMVDIAKKESS